MFILLLSLIYIAFISLGLPDALLGSAWPVMFPALDVPVSYAGVIAFIISAGTIVSSLNTTKVIRKFGTGKVTAFSTFITAVALLGFSVSSEFWMLLVWSIPCGLGAGAIDAALNGYVAEHYSAKHMNWLHAFWGVGASIGPYIMSYSLIAKDSWQTGYIIVGLIQMALAIVLFLTLPVWHKQPHLMTQQGETQHVHLNIKEALRTKGVKYILTAFFGYCALEATAGLWATSYLVLEKGIDAESAAKWASLFYLGITGGRFLNGFVADRFGNKNMIRAGISLVGVGICILFLPLEIELLALAGLLVIGLGCAPIYPSIIHETPRSFGAENAQAIIGIQMASAYLGTTLMPPLFGLIADYISISLYPLFLILLMGLMLVMTEKLNHMQNKLKHQLNR